MANFIFYKANFLYNFKNYIPSILYNQLLYCISTSKVYNTLLNSLYVKGMVFVSKKTFHRSKRFQWYKLDTKCVQLTKLLSEHALFQ